MVWCQRCKHPKQCFSATIHKQFVYSTHTFDKEEYFNPFPAEFGQPSPTHATDLQGDGLHCTTTPKTPQTGEQSTVWLWLSTDPLCKTSSFYCPLNSWGEHVGAAYSFLCWEARSLQGVWGRWHKETGETEEVGWLWMSVYSRELVGKPGPLLNFPFTRDKQAITHPFIFDGQVLNWKARY